MTLGEKLQRLRKSRSWTQEELAEKVGVSRQSLSKWESDSALPDTANIIVLADLFGVTTDYLLRELPAEAATPASSAAPQVVQLVPPQKKAPPNALLIGIILLVVGALIWLGLVLLSYLIPVSVARGDTFVSGLHGFLLAFNLHTVYYLSLLCALLGLVVIVVYLLLRWWFSRRKEAR